MQGDSARENLKVALWKQGASLAEASLAIGRNKAYLQQYLARGMPRVLSFQDSEKLGELLRCDPATLRHDTLPAPRPWTGPRRRRTAGASVAEVEVEVAAGAGAWNEDFVHEKARWRLPEAMVRHEGDAAPEALRILRVRGNSMEPELREGDRIVVDTARTMPAAGELFVLWDGTGLVVKRIEALTAEGMLRLASAHPDYAPYERSADDVHIVGKVLWKVTRA